MEVAIVVIVAVILVTILLVGRQTKRRIAAEADARAQFEKFKRNAYKIEVDLEKCELLANSYVEEVAKDRHRGVAFYDALYKPENNIDRQSVNMVVLVWEAEYRGETRKFYSPVVHYSNDVVLRMKLYEQKQTCIYVGDNGRYYFDLEFMFGDE